MGDDNESVGLIGGKGEINQSIIRNMYKTYLVPYRIHAGFIQENISYRIYFPNLLFQILKSNHVAPPGKFINTKRNE